jgi:formate hydrogenlyase subunit 4
MTVLFLSVLTAVFFPGLIVRVKSILSGRKGPGILQPWKNIWLLLRKGSVISHVTSFIFSIAPVVYFCTVLCAILLLPFPGRPTFFSFEADFVFFAYLLAFGKFLFILNALDTGSSFEGMGANREALYSMLAEPAFFILFGTLALLTGNTSFAGIFSNLQAGGASTTVIMIIAVYLLVQIAMIENSRMPVDDPKTHLELTMIHEVMILDHSGFNLALIQAGTIFKFAMYGTLIANCLIPPGLGFALQIVSFLGIQAGFAVSIGILESFRARKKLAKNPQFILTLSSIALIAFGLALLITFKLIP